MGGAAWRMKEAAPWHSRKIQGCATAADIHGHATRPAGTTRAGALEACREVCLSRCRASQPFRLVYLISQEDPLTHGSIRPTGPDEAQPTTNTDQAIVSIQCSFPIRPLQQVGHPRER